MAHIRKLAPGVAFVLVLSLLAVWLGSLVPMIGGPVFGIVLGLLVNNTFDKPRYTVPGVLFSSKNVLQWAVVALGCGLSLSAVWETGRESAGVMLFSLLAAFAAAYGFGRLLKIPGRLQVLIGAGTGICGGSAIAALSPIVEADEVEIAYSISTIFLFNIAAVLIFPPVGHLLGFTDRAFGLWAGTAINDTSSVVAAGYLYSDAAGAYATIVKLARTTTIIPIALLMAVLVGLRRKREGQGDTASGYSFVRIFPWFILWFLVASLFNTLGLFGKDLLHGAGIAAKFMIVMALTGIGLSADLRKMIRTGLRPIMFGLLVWIVVACVSLLAQRLSGQL